MNPYAFAVIEDGKFVLYPFLERGSFNDLKDRVPGLMDCVEKARNQLNASSS